MKQQQPKHSSTGARRALVGDPSQALSKASDDRSIEPCQRVYIYGLMETPGLGLPITWNSNMQETKLPPLHAIRAPRTPCHSLRMPQLRRR